MEGPVILLPRLEPADVQRIVDALDPENGPGHIEGLVELPDAATFAAVGGRRVSIDELLALRRAVLGVATDAGYPDADSAEARARFDAAVTPVLATSELLQSGEALRDDVWAFIACWLLAPVTFWRYGASPERWHGGVRNTFQRIWLRARALDRGEGADDRWGLVEALTEDAHVAIVERPALASQQPLARAIAEGWVRAAAAYGRNRMQGIMRDAIITMRLRNEITALREVSPEELQRIVDEAFRRAGDSSADSAAPSISSAAPAPAPTEPQDPDAAGDGWFRKALALGRGRRR